MSQAIKYSNFSEQEINDLRQTANTFAQYGCFYEAEVILHTLYCFNKNDINIQNEYLEILLSSKKSVQALEFIENNNIKNSLIKSKVYIANNLYEKANMCLFQIDPSEKNTLLINKIKKYLNINFFNNPS